MNGLDLRINIKVGDAVFQRDAQDDVSINIEDISEDIQKQSAIYCHYAMRHAEVESLVEQLKFDVEVAESKKATSVRENALSSGAKITDKQLELAVMSDENIQEIKSRLLEAKHAAGILKAVTRSLEHKKDMLEQLCYQKQAELRILQSSGIG